jgi:saccharopine dehydrogenase-like NADP-dependent oxidoreductase
MSKKKVLILGAGRSAYSIIQYFSDHADRLQLELKVIDREASRIISKIENFSGKAEDGDLTDRDYRQDQVKESDLVISMLPVRFHLMIADDCVAFKKNMITASYVTPDMEALDAKAKKAGITILNEVGLDPGIDHMSAMRVIDGIREKGGEIKAFESFTGGLLAPEFEDDNPWKYKFTWNPRNVVMASAGGAVKFIDHGMYKYIPYHKVFRRTEIIDLDKYGKFEGYANRDSLKYIKLYGLENVDTMFRGTFRRPGFCKAWNVFVQLGATDDSYVLADSDKMTHRSFINSFLKYHPTDSVELKLMQYLKLDQDDVDIMEKLEWLGIFSDEPVRIKNGSPADILQSILEKKWTLQSGERDMIVMWHKFIYTEKGKTKELHSSMVMEGKNDYETAMTTTVGLPLAISAELILTGKFTERGVLRPLMKELYIPVLHSLKEYGIRFTDRQVS